MADKYLYGSADTVPHIHLHNKGGDCHLKIVDRGSVKRYNLITNGKTYQGQVDMAIEAAAGNPALVEAIRAAVREYGG